MKYSRMKLAAVMAALNLSTASALDLTTALQSHDPKILLLITALGVTLLAIKSNQRHRA